MCKNYFLVLLMLLLSIRLHAATFPTLSTSEQTEWYFIQFLNGENVLAAQGDGEQVKTAVPTGRSSQLWKVEGSPEAGYLLTSKTGLKLYVNQTAKEGKFFAASVPASNDKMNIVVTTNGTYKDGFEIQPKNNSGVSMNQWGGAGTGKELGLWDKGDANNPLKFVSEEEFKKSGQGYPLIPYPKSVTSTEEGLFSVNGLTTATYPDDETRKVIEQFANLLKNVSGIALTVEAGGTERKENALSLVTDPSLTDEGYTLEVDHQGVLIKAARPTGFFYAIQTLKQLLPREFFGKNAQPSVPWTLPYVKIEDQPLLGHRGYMLDIARHFFDKAEVKRILDIMSLYKLNRFHWHLTDDQGWRIEIPEYPLLTEVGSIREGSFVNAGGSSKFFDDTEYGRGKWYSLEDLREIVAYAKERHIEIIPEVDLPGHMVAAITAYPEFSCDPKKKYSVRIDGGISQDVLNIGKDEVIDFLKCVLGHVAEVFPYQYIHLGGDECPTTQWTTNPDCLARVKAEGLGGVNELQSWLVEELGVYLKTHYNKDIVVWDELLAHWKSDNQVKPVIMAWNSINKSGDAANKGFKSIVVPYQSLYFDMMQVSAGQADINEVYQGGWGEGYVNTVQTVYSVNPLAALSGRESYCLGVQGNMWTETTNDNEQLEYQLLPRLLALSEIGWLPASQKNWISFYSRLQTHDEILDSLGYIYAKHYIEPAELTPADDLLNEAGCILEASVRGAVGYPSAELFDNLQEAFSNLKATPTDGNLQENLKKAIQDYQNADIILPKAGKIYQLLSASTYYKKRYVGSSIYEKDSGLSFHYTPQTEPEELWQFIPVDDGGYLMKNYTSGKLVSLPEYNKKAVLEKEKSTPLRIDRASVAAGKYTYVPGALTLSAVEGYSSTATGQVKRLFGNPTGQIFAFDDPTLCNPGTWRLVEVTDFRTQLEGLCNKCERIIEKSHPGEVGQPQADALEFLQKSLITPAKNILVAGDVSEEIYLEYVGLYNTFLAMPRASLLDGISETNYYYIRNAYFTGYYAKANKSIRSVEPKSLVSNDDSFRWNFVKNGDGSVTIYNKATGTAAYISDLSDGQTIKIGSSKTNNTWIMSEITTDLSNKGIAIMEKSCTYSWYANPSSFANVLTKPYDWGASIWILEKLDEIIPTAIGKTEKEPEKGKIGFDLQGRPVSKYMHGIYILGDKKYVK